MLQLSKNSLVTGAARNQIEIRQLEVDWYCGNYSTIAGQAAMLAGFAFSQLTTPMPEDYVPPLILEFGYLFLTCMAVGLELSAIMLSTFLTVWGPSLALRGRRGVADLHRSVDCLRDYQFLTFSYFMIGWILFFISNILQVWIYFKRRVALVVSVPMSLFIVAIVWYSYDITRELRLQTGESVEGRIGMFKPYEYIGDIDHGLHSAEGGMTRAAGMLGGSNGYADTTGYCPVHRPDSFTEHFRPRLAAETAAVVAAKRRGEAGSGPCFPRVE